MEYYEQIKSVVAEMKKRVEETRAAYQAACDEMDAALALLHPEKAPRKTRAKKSDVTPNAEPRKSKVVSRAVKQADGSVRFPEEGAQS